MLACKVSKKPFVHKPASISLLKRLMPFILK